MLEVRNLKKTYYSGGRQIKAVNGISFTANENEIFGVVGESGCGKSTLGRLILRLIKPSGGQIFINGMDITNLSRHAIRPLRRNMQMVFQNPFASFNPRIRIGAALMEVCRYYGMSAAESKGKIAGLFADTGLGEEMFYNWPRELSGGQLQRLAIARALLSEPNLIIADEPLSALDVSVQAQLLNLLEDLCRSRTMTMVFISHDMNVVEYFCDRVAVMYMGIIMELLSAAELSANAMHPYTRTLKASAPRLDVFKDSSAAVQGTSTCGEGGIETFIIKGEIPNPKEQIKGCPFAPRCSEASGSCKNSLPELKQVSSGHWVRCCLS